MQANARIYSGSTAAAAMSETRAEPTGPRTLFNRWLILNWRLDHHGVRATYVALLSVVQAPKFRPKCISRFNKPPNFAQKDTSWFNKLLILLHSGQRPPLCLRVVFVREEQRLIISIPIVPRRHDKTGSLPSPPRSGRVRRNMTRQPPAPLRRAGGQECGLPARRRPRWPRSQEVGGRAGRGGGRRTGPWEAYATMCITPPRRGGPKGRGGFLKCPRGPAPDSRLLTLVTSRPCESTPSGRLPRAGVRGWPGLQPNGAGDYPWDRCLCWYH